MFSVNPSGEAADRNIMEQKRKETRSMCADLLKVRWRTQSGIQRNEFGTLEDISSTGACIQLEEPIHPGTRLTLFYPDGKYRGRVKYCIAQGNIFLVGMEFDADSHWSVTDFKPSHLLQLRQEQAKPE
jgi:hypothetical protein